MKGGRGVVNEHLQIVITVVTVIAALVSSWSLIMIAVGRLYVRKCFKSLESKIEEVSGTSEECKKLEISILKLRADLPLEYVRREDFIRFDTVINVKLDRLHDLITNMREQKK